MNKIVPFFNYPEVYKKSRDNYLKIFDDVCSRGAFILQNELHEFERNLASFVGSKYAIGVGNATDAMQLLLISADIKRGSEVLISTHTMIATASAIKMAGLVPVLVDIGSDGLIDPEKIEARITSNTVAIMPTQLNGRVCDMNRINEIAQKYGLMIFEDSAQALGAKFDNICAGNFGVGGCISFYPAKTLGCFGDGGAIICNDENTYEKIKALRDHGRDSLGEIKFWGFNSRLDNLQAAFLNYDLENYQKAIGKRREIAEIYSKKLSNIKNFVLPPSDENTLHFDVYQNYEIQADNRDMLRDHLNNFGIGTLIQWGGKLLHQHKKLKLSANLPAADFFSQRYLMIPLNTSMTFEDAEYVADCIGKFYK